MNCFFAVALGSKRIVEEAVRETQMGFGNILIDG
jgi:hypothetical protein